MALIRKFYHNPEEYDLVEHTMANLQAVLDSYRGHGSYLLEAGIADRWFDKPTPSHLEQVEDEFKQMLARFEPRIEVTLFEPIQPTAKRRPGILLKCQIRSSGVPLEIRYDAKGARVTRVG